MSTFVPTLNLPDTCAVLQQALSDPDGWRVAEDRRPDRICFVSTTGIAIVWRKLEGLYRGQDTAPDITFSLLVMGHESVICGSSGYTSLPTPQEISLGVWKVQATGQLAEAMSLETFQSILRLNFTLDGRARFAWIQRRITWWVSLVYPDASGPLRMTRNQSPCTQHIFMQDLKEVAQAAWAEIDAVGMLVDSGSLSLPGALVDSGSLSLPGAPFRLVHVDDFNVTLPTSAHSRAALLAEFGATLPATAAEFSHSSLEPV